MQRSAVEIVNRYADVEGRSYRACFMNGTARFVVQQLHGQHEGKPLKLDGKVAKAVLAKIASQEGGNNAV